jgi:hypothetical protein
MPFDYTKYTPASTSLTLTKDIQPLMQVTCALKSCHGAGTAAGAADHDPKLGVINQPTAADFATIHDALVGKPSAEVTSMNYVTAGDPANSWMMKKIEGANTCGKFTCATVTGENKPCGDQMPAPPSDPLSDGDIGKFRDWIKGGATL